MSAVPIHDLYQLLGTYGYWAVFIFIAIESTGIPFPGETMLLVAAIYAGTTHHLSIFLVIVAAACGAILGDNLGFAVIVFRGVACGMAAGRGCGWVTGWRCGSRLSGAVWIVRPGVTESDAAVVVVVVVASDPAMRRRT